MKTLRWLILAGIILLPILTNAQVYVQLNVDQPSLFVMEDISDLSVCAGELVQLEVTGNYNDYLWNNGAKTPSVTVDTSGVYTVKVTNPDHCSATDSVTVIFENCTYIQQYSRNGNIDIYPVPNQGELHIDIPGFSETATLEIFSATGQLLATEYQANFPATLDVRNLNPGMYLLKIQDKSGEAISRKIIIE